MQYSVKLAPKTVALILQGKRIRAVLDQTQEPLIIDPVLELICDMSWASRHRGLKAFDRPRHSVCQNLRCMVDFKMTASA